MKKVLFFFLLFEFSNFIASSQKYTISGFIREKGSMELLIGVNIYIPELKTGTYSNNYGFYSIIVPKGKYHISYSYVGYKDIEQEIDLNNHLEINISLEPFLELNEVVIKADQNKKISESSRMSNIEIPVKQIQKIPALLGEKDVLKVIQLMPGVQKGKEGTSGLYVRGGNVDQNLIILDDATVYNAYHLFGFFSIFNGDAIKSVELIKGGFPARYGGRLSSVLEMNLKDGNKEAYHGEASIGLLSSKLLVEGPIIKNKSSFLFSGRRTYIDLLMRPFESSDEKVGYYFYDINAKLNYEIDNKNKLYLSGYFGKDKFYDRYKYDQDKSDINVFWKNETATFRWNHLFNNKLFANTSVIYSNYKFEILDQEKSYQDVYELKYYSGIRDVGIKYDMEYHPFSNHIIRTGLSSTFHTFRPGAFVEKLYGYDTSLMKINDINTLENGLYAEDEFSILEKFKFNIGFRLSNFIHNEKQYYNPEPRVSGSYLIGKNIAIKASYVLMNQYVHLLSNTGIGLPTDLWVPSTDRIPPQKSQQIALGLAKDFTKYNFTASLEGYYKRSKNVIGFVEGASFLLLGDPSLDNKIDWQDNVTSGNAWSYGMEVLIQRKSGKLSGWIGYTLSWTQLQFDDIYFGKKFYAAYDRRHDLSIVGVYEITKKITLSATWIYGTGSAISLPLSEYPTNSRWGYYYSSYGYDYGEKNSFRMAPYHRLDIGVQFHKKLKNNRERTIEVSIYNVYNRKNPYFYFVDYGTLKQVSLFPILPSIAYNYKF